MSAKSKCWRCSSHKCGHRIRTADGTFDEVACDRHAKDLAVFADAKLGNAMRTHTTSSGNLSRGNP